MCPISKSHTANEMKKEILKNLENSIFITKDILRTISNEDEEIISKNLLRWTKSGDIIKLKNGLYLTKDTFVKYNKIDGFTELIANKLRTPSYVSLEYALSKYGILTEVVYSITSVTLKTKREYENKTGKYIYKSIKRDLFFGYDSKRFLDYSYIIATKEKALFDFLYLKKNSLPNDLKNINLVEELRLNLDTFGKRGIKNLDRYKKICSDSKLNNIINNIIENAPNRK
jgi:predicted transcriptional regulator of viral defense system